MKIYCIKCKKGTNGVGEIKVMKTNNRFRVTQECAKCSKMKSQFVSSKVGEELSGEGIIDNIIDTTKDVIKGAIKGGIKGAFRYDYPPDMRKIIEDNKDVAIEEMIVTRVPLSKGLKTIINLISSGKFQGDIKKLGYDDVFHLFITFRTANNEFFVTEKNQTIILKKVKGWYEGDGGESIQVPLNEPITVKQLFENAKAKVNKTRLFVYDPFKANCQVYCHDLLVSNGIGNQEVIDFIMQDVTGLLEGSDAIKGIMKGVTDFAGILDRIVKGSGF